MLFSISNTVWNLHGYYATCSFFKYPAVGLFLPLLLTLLIFFLFLSLPVGHDQPYKIKDEEKWYKYKQLHCATSTEIEKICKPKCIHDFSIYISHKIPLQGVYHKWYPHACLQECCMSNVYKLCTLQCHMQPARGLYYFNFKRLFTERVKQTLELRCDWLMS